MKIGYQLKQVRERLAKGLVDKGILRTEKRNFLLFDMATHPVVDGGAKEEIRRRVRNVLTQRTVVLNSSQWLPENLEFRYLRTVSMVCAAYAANVLENALSTLGHEAREKAFNQTDELLADYSQWPFGRKATGNDIGENLPQVIGEVRPSRAFCVHQIQITDTSAGSQQGAGQGASTRSRRCLSVRLHSPRFPPLIRSVLLPLPGASPQFLESFYLSCDYASQHNSHAATCRRQPIFRHSFCSSGNLPCQCILTVTAPLDQGIKSTKKTYL